MDEGITDSVLDGWQGLPLTASAIAALLLICLLGYALALASGFRIRRWLTGDSRPRSLRRTLVTGLILMTTLPMISLALVMADRSERAQEGLAGDRLQATVAGIAVSVDQIIDKHRTGVVEIARNIEQDGRIEDDALFRWLRLHNVVYNDFLTMLVTNHDGDILVASKLEDGRTKRMPIEGHNVSDRSYFFTPMLTGKPFVSEAFRGRGLGTDAIVAVSAPFSLDGRRIDGVVEGSLDLAVFQRFQSLFRLENTELLIADANRRVIYSTTPQTHPVLAQLLPDDPQLVGDEQATARVGSNLIVSARTEQGWTVHLSAPMAPIIDNIRRDYLAAWVWVGAAIVISALLALAIARRVARPLARLRRAVESVKLDDELSPIEAQDGAPREVAMVFEHLNEMRHRLAGAYRDVQASLTAEARAREALAAREAVIEQKSRELEKANAELERISRTDKLTGLANRHAFNESAELAWRTAARADSEVALIMVDIDYFKRFNDRYGHPAGDACLRRVADVLRGAAGRALDVVARYGGEEFVIILTDTGLDAAVQVADRVRAGVAAMRMEHSASAFGIVTVSAGVACDRPSQGGLFDDLLEQADGALYAAKGAGRNFVSSLPAPAGMASHGT